MVGQQTLNLFILVRLQVSERKVVRLIGGWAEEAQTTDSESVYLGSQPLRLMSRRGSDSKSRNEIFHTKYI